MEIILEHYTRNIQPVLDARAELNSFIASVNLYGLLSEPS